MDNNEKEEEIIHIKLFGANNVGKKSIIKWYENNLSSFPYQQKEGEKSACVLLKLTDKKEVKIILSSEPYNDDIINKLIINNYENIILVGDLTNEKSFDIIKQMINVLKNIDKKCIVIFINKFDLQTEKKIELKDVKIYAQNNKIKYFSTSSGTGFNLIQGLTYIVEKKTGKTKNESENNIKEGKEETKKESVSSINESEEYSFEEIEVIEEIEEGDSGKAEPKLISEFDYNEIKEMIEEKDKMKEKNEKIEKYLDDKKKCCKCCVCW